MNRQAILVLSLSSRLTGGTLRLARPFFSLDMFLNWNYIM